MFATSNSMYVYTHTHTHELRRGGKIIRCGGIHLGQTVVVVLYTWKDKRFHATLLKQAKQGKDVMKLCKGLSQQLKHMFSINTAAKSPWSRSGQAYIEASSG